jgi:hypothetical protein
MKNKILELRAQGQSYRKIQEILGCSKATISYHCGAGQKDKNKKRLKKFREKNPLARKIDHFKADDKSMLHNRVSNFHRLGPRKNSTYQKRNFHYKDVVEKFGIETKCYLTGRYVNLLDASTYELDHMIPRSKGGLNILDNCGISCPEANQAKRNMNVAEFLKLCEEVLSNFGYKIIPPENN